MPLINGVTLHILQPGIKTENTELEPVMTLKLLIDGLNPGSNVRVRYILGFHGQFHNGRILPGQPSQGRKYIIRGHHSLALVPGCGCYACLQPAYLCQDIETLQTKQEPPFIPFYSPVHALNHYLQGRTFSTFSVVSSNSYVLAIAKKTDDV